MIKCKQHRCFPSVLLVKVLFAIIFVYPFEHNCIVVSVIILQQPCSLNSMSTALWKAHLQLLKCNVKTFLNLCAVLRIANVCRHFSNTAIDEKNLIIINHMLLNEQF